MDFPKFGFLYLVTLFKKSEKANIGSNDKKKIRLLIKEIEQGLENKNG